MHDQSVPSEQLPVCDDRGLAVDDRDQAAHDALFDPFATVNSTDPYPRYGVLRDRHPVYHVAARDVWVLSRFEDVSAASRDWSTFGNPPSVDLDDTGSIVGPGSFIDFDPPEHTKFRRTLQAYFAPKHIRATYTRLVEGLVDDLLAELDGADEADLADALAWPLPVAMLCHLLGFPPSDVKPLTRLFRDLVAREPGSTVAPEFTRRAASELTGYLADLIDERSASPGDDLLSVILAAREGGTILDSEIRGLCFLLFAAGTSTTAGLISNSFEVLARHPDQRRLLARSAVDMAEGVEELLRYEAPVHYLARTAKSDVTLHGVTIPRGARLALLYGAANRDERRCERPDAFDVGRESKKHLSFGDGIHLCLGAPLARLECRVLLERFLATYPNYVITGKGRRSTEHTTRGYFSLPAALS